MAQYQWAVGGPKPRVDAQVFGEFVADLRGDDDGVIAKQIVEAARPRRSLIHNLFIWDDKREAELYRVIKARHYLGRLVRVDVKPGEPVAREYFITVNGTQKYTAREHIIGNDDRMLQVLRSIDRELSIVLTRYNTWLLLTPAGEQLNRAMQELRNDIEKINERAEERITKPKRRSAGGGARVHV